METKSKITAIGSVLTGLCSGYSLMKYLSVAGSGNALRRLWDIICFGAFTRKTELLPPEGPSEFTEKMWMSLNSEWQNIADKMGWVVPHVKETPFGPYIDKLELASKQEVFYGGLSSILGVATLLGTAYTIYANREGIKMQLKHIERGLRKNQLLKRLIGYKDPLDDSNLPDYLNNMYALR